MKRYLLIISLLIFCCSCNAQSESVIDTVVIEFLKSKSSSDNPRLEIKSNGNAKVISRNYFWQPEVRIEKDTLRITGYIFGFSASHSKTYSLIEIISQSEKEYFVIDEIDHNKAVECIMRILSPYSLLNWQVEKLKDALLKPTL